jgi:hypothetical protein
MESKETRPVAACGLYCGACRKFTTAKCPGCRANEKASWCDIRKCCIERRYASCADCTEHPDPKQCRKLNSFIGKVMGFVFNSNRFACISRIHEIGYEAYAAEMDKNGLQTLKRR